MTIEDLWLDYSVHIFISGSNKIKPGENIRQFHLFVSDVYRMSNPFGSCFENNFASTPRIYKSLTRDVRANGKFNYSHSTFKCFSRFPHDNGTSFHNIISHKQKLSDLNGFTSTKENAFTVFSQRDRCSYLPLQICPRFISTKNILKITYILRRLNKL